MGARNCVRVDQYDCAGIRLIMQKLQSCDCGRRAVSFVRLEMNVVQNDGEFCGHNFTIRRSSYEVYKRLLPETVQHATNRHLQPCKQANHTWHGDRGSTVVKVLCYKSVGRWFDPSWCQLNFSLTQNPSDRTMAVGSTQLLTEMSTSWG